MILVASIPWLDISINLLLVLFVIDCLGITLLVLMQRPKQEGLGAAFGAGVTDQVFGARTTNVLQRATVYLGSLFFLFALALSILISYRNKGSSMVSDKPVEKPKVEAPAAPAEQPQPKSLSEELPAETTEPAPAPPLEVAPVEEPAPSGSVPAPAPADEKPAEAPAPVETPEPEEKSSGQ